MSKGQRNNQKKLNALLKKGNLHLGSKKLRLLPNEKINEIAGKPNPSFHFKITSLFFSISIAVGVCLLTVIFASCVMYNIAKLIFILSLIFGVQQFIKYKKAITIKELIKKTKQDSPKIKF